MSFASLRDLSIFKLPQFKAAGWTMRKALRLFGSKANYMDAVNELENALYEKEA